MMQAVPPPAAPNLAFLTHPQWMMLVMMMMMMTTHGRNTWKSIRFNRFWPSSLRLLPQKLAVISILPVSLETKRLVGDVGATTSRVTGPAWILAGSGTPKNS